MHIRHQESQGNRIVLVELVTAEDYKTITKARFFFNWKTEKKYLVYKLRIVGEKAILGLMSIQHFQAEKRIEIKLLAVSKENRGKHKVYEGIAGNLIAYACREAVNLHAEKGCVSLIPKDEIRNHYMKKYGMEDAGWQIFLEGLSLFRMLKKYEV
jgi:hypothetical protein